MLHATRRFASFSATTSSRMWGMSARSFNTEMPAPLVEQSLAKKIGFLGGGQMCEAILGALRKHAAQDMKQCVVHDLHEDRLKYLEEKYGVQTTRSAQSAVDDAEIVLLCVKPQNVDDIASQVKLDDKSMVISIIAGLTLGRMSKLFSTKNIVRSMPNTPAMVLEGITVWMPTSETSEELAEKARVLIGCFGDEIRVDQEHYIDMATAISGSGPAYVFLTIEAMIDAAVHLGFPREMASKLVLSTIKGSAIYAQASGHHLSKLRNNVTSPGGTTASALYEFERGRYRTVTADAIWAAYRRTLELGGKNSNLGPGRSKYR